MKRFSHERALQAEGMVTAKAESCYRNKKKVSMAGEQCPKERLQSQVGARSCRILQPVWWVLPPSLLLPSLLSFLSWLSTQRLNPFLNVLRIFGIPQLLSLYGRHTTLVIKLENMEDLLFQLPLQVGAGARSTFSQSDAQTPGFKPEASEAKKLESWKIHREFQ